MHVNWHGVFPAITTQFHADQSLNLEGTTQHLETMIQAGIHGVVLLGSVGENTALEYAEKLGIDGLMVLSGMVYKFDEREAITHFRTIAASTSPRGLRQTRRRRKHRRDQGVLRERSPHGHTQGMIILGV